MALLSLLVKLGIDTTSFHIGVKQAEERAAAMNKKIAASSGGWMSNARNLGSALAGYFTVSAVTQYMAQVSEMVTEIKDMSELLGVSTDQAQMLKSAADGASRPFADIVKAFQQIDAAKAKAMSGDAASKSLFAVLGIDPYGMSNIDILRKTIDASGGSATQTAAAIDLLGGKVASLRLVVEELNKQGQINLIDESQIQQIDDAQKALNKAGKELKIAAIPLATGVASFLTMVLNGLNPSFVSKQFAKATDQSNVPEAQRMGFGEQLHIGVLRGIMDRKAFRESFAKVTAEFMGLDLSTQDRFEALPLGDRKSDMSQTQDQYAQWMKSMAESSKKTADILEKQTAQ